MRILLIANFILLGFMAQAQTPDVGDFFPVKDILDLEGNKISTSKLLENNGKPVVIDFWATWCKPCLLSIKSMHANYPKWQEETGVKIILVSIDEERMIGKIVHFQELKEWKFDLYRDDNFILKKSLGFNSVPQTYLLNSEGKILYHSSEGGEEEKLHKAIKKAAK